VDRGGSNPSPHGGKSGGACAGIRPETAPEDVRDPSCPRRCSHENRFPVSVERPVVTRNWELALAAKVSPREMAEGLLAPPLHAESGEGRARVLNLIDLAKPSDLRANESGNRPVAQQKQFGSAA